MDKKVYFVTGLPRSCSTLLCNLLAQNPRFHSTATSAVLDLVHTGRAAMTNNAAFKAWNEKDAAMMMQDFGRGGITHAFDSLTDRPVVFAKERGATGILDYLFKTIPDAKLLVTVRDMRGILTSMETLRKENPEFLDSTEVDPMNGSTIEKRVQAWLAGPALGVYIERLHEAKRVYGDKLFFVHAEDLTEEPIETLEKIHKYLGEDFDPKVYDPKNVEQYTHEHDGIWFPQGNHKIKPEIKPLQPKWVKVLGRELSEQIRIKFEWINEL